MNKGFSIQESEKNLIRAILGWHIALFTLHKSEENHLNISGLLCTVQIQESKSCRLTHEMWVIIKVVADNSYLC